MTFDEEAIMQQFKLLQIGPSGGSASVSCYAWRNRYSSIVVIEGPDGPKAFARYRTGKWQPKTSVMLSKRMSRIIRMACWPEWS